MYALSLFIWSTLLACPSPAFEEKKLAQLPGDYDLLMLDVVFSPDGRQAAYTDCRGSERQYVVVGGKKGDLFPDFVPLSLGFTPPGEATYITLKEDESTGDTECTLVVGAKKYGPHAVIQPPVFNPDGKVMACSCSPDMRRSIVVVDGKPQPGELDLIVDLAVTSGGKSIVALGMKDLFGAVMTNGKWEKYDKVGLLTRTPDGKSVACPVKKGEEHFLLVGDRKLPAPQGEPAQVVFSPDGQKVAFGAREDRELWWKVIPAE